VRNNHLIEPIQGVLESATASMTEYELIQQLVNMKWLDASGNNSNSLELYSTHFLVFNALFHLDQSLSEQRVFISALNIQLLPLDVTGLSDSRSIDSQALDSASLDEDLNQAASDELRRYYLDWNNLDDATQESVDNLLTRFWDCYVSESDYIHALDVLGLPSLLQADLSSKAFDKKALKKQAKQQYRKMAMKYHPDRGGEAEMFHRIQWAYGVFQRALQE